MKKSNAPVERDILDMYSRQEVEVRSGVLERVDHIVWHIRAGARLGINPPAPQKDSHQRSQKWDGRMIMHVLEPSLAPVPTQLLIMRHSRARNTHRVHVDRFQIVRVRIIRLLRTVGIECARNLKELLGDVREKSTLRDRKRTVAAVGRTPARNVVRLDLQSP